MINLTIDIGNSNVMICCFRNKLKINSFSFNTSDLNKNYFLDYLKKIKFKSDQINVIVSSVVPNVTKLIISVLKNKKIHFYYVGDLIKCFDLKTNIINKKNIGDDRLVNVIYAKNLYLKSVIVIDFGTATTIDVLDKFGIYDGGIITPGIDLSLKSLHIGTAKLPLVKFRKTKRIVGKNTVEAIRSGFFWGYISMIKGLVHKIELEKKYTFKLIITGGHARFFKSAFKNAIKIDEYFNSKGLNFIMNNYLKKLS